MKFAFAFALSLFVSSGMSAQEYAFKVLVNKGQNQVKAGNEWLPIQVGASLKSQDELKISQNAYLGLVHSSGKPLEVKKAGNHKVADLAGQIKGGSSVLNKYTDFILSANEQKNGNLTATGAVYRGNEDIKVFLPKPQFAIVYNDQISIAWSSLPGTKEYIIRFNSMFGDELAKLEIGDTTVSINLNTPKFKNEDNILVIVTSKADQSKSSESFMLKKLSSADKTRIKNSLSEIAAQTTEQTALNSLLLAGFYEQNSLLIDASTAYQVAIKLAPNVAAFQEAYSDFLKRNL
jgi:uncharacterized protein YdhG (YjbR/CyaY superfamily)